MDSKGVYLKDNVPEGVRDYVIKCVNSHEALVGAATELLSSLQSANIPSEVRQKLDQESRDLHAALTQAQEE